jgi:DNA-binding NarL/FixJ family response regulator
MDQPLRLAILDLDADVRLGRRMVISTKSNIEIVLDSNGTESDILAVVNGLVDVIVMDHRLAVGQGVAFYDRLRRQMGIKQAPGCVLTTSFERPAQLLATLEVGVMHVVAVDQGPESLLDAIQLAGAGKSEIALDELHVLVSSEQKNTELDLELAALVQALPERFASNLRRLRSVWAKAIPDQLRSYSLSNLDGLVARLPVRTASELIIKLERSGLLSGE